MECLYACSICRVSLTRKLGRRHGKARLLCADSAQARFWRAQAFLQGLLERAASGLRFPHAFHLRGEREQWPCVSTGLREFLEGKLRDLAHDVINARLEAGGGARDVVLEFVEQVAVFQIQRTWIV